MDFLDHEALLLSLVIVFILYIFYSTFQFAVIRRNLNEIERHLESKFKQDMKWTYNKGRSDERESIHNTRIALSKEEQIKIQKATFTYICSLMEYKQTGFKGYYTMSSDIMENLKYTLGDGDVDENE